MQQWEKDKVATDPFLPMVKAICGVFVIHEAPLEEDREHNSDLMVLSADGIRIAARLRSPAYFKRFPHEFTIRDSRPSGAMTEWDKVLQGFGDYFFYGFRGEIAPHLVAFGLLDLSMLRVWVMEYVEKFGVWPGKGGIPNPDGTTFRAIEWKHVPLASLLVMYPPSIAIGNSLLTKEAGASIQLTMKLTYPGYEPLEDLSHLA